MHKRRFHDQSIFAIVAHFLLVALFSPLSDQGHTRASRLTGLADGNGNGNGGPVSRPQWTIRRFWLVWGSAMALVLGLSVVVLSGLYHSSALRPLAIPMVLTAVATPVPTAPPAPTPPPGIQATVLHVYGGAGLLAQPQEALRLRDGRLAIADTGHHQVLLLGMDGKPNGSITAGQNGVLKAPFSLALALDGSLLVLDSDAGQVLKYGSDGRLLAASNASLPLGHSRGIAVDAQGEVLVADPAMNAIYTLGADLSSLRVQPAVTEGKPELFNQPSAVAAGPNGTILVVDSQNNRLREFSSSWILLHEWPVGVSDTQHSPHVVSLAGGAVLVSSPSAGKLLLVTAGSDSVRAYDLPGGISSQPLGITMLGKSEVLVTCSGTGTVVDARLPGLPGQSTT